MKNLEEVRVDIEELERLEKDTSGPWEEWPTDQVFREIRVEGGTSIGNIWNPLNATYIVALRNAFPSIAKELSVLREAVKRFEGMEISNFEETMEDYKGLNAVNNLWKHKRDIISAWVKEQLEE